MFSPASGPRIPETKRVSAVGVPPDLDAYDQVEYFDPQRGRWILAYIAAVNESSGTYDLQEIDNMDYVNKPPSVGGVDISHSRLIPNVPAMYIRRKFSSTASSGRSFRQGDDMDEESTDLLRHRQLGASMQCENVDEFNFQMQTALLSSVVLKYLDQPEDTYIRKTEKEIRSAQASPRVRQFSRSSLSGMSMYGLGSPTLSSAANAGQRGRSSSWLSSTASMMAGTTPAAGVGRLAAASFQEGPLLDRLMEKTADFPTLQCVMKMMELINTVHSQCPFTNSGGSSTVSMGTNCTVMDYAAILASANAVRSLVTRTRESLEQKAPTALINATVPAGGRLIVCGDTHGQIEDVLWVFFKHGVPSPTNVYVFDGDIADRGGHALEIFLLLMMFKAVWYNSVHIIRGNHEDDYCNIYYGFLAELKHKFGPVAGGSLHSAFLNLFYALPLACVVDSWVGLYRCELTGAIIELNVIPPAAPGGQRSPGSAGSATSPGGGGRGLTLNAPQVEISLRRKDAAAGHKALIKGEPQELVFEKRSAVRAFTSDGRSTVKWSAGDSWDYISKRILIVHGGIPLPPTAKGAPAPYSTQPCVYLRQFHEMPNKMKIPPAPKSVLEQWMYQVLWSDPEDTDGQKCRGTPFLAQHTKAFTEINNLHAVIRAHQLPPNQRGVSFHHKQKLITLFTASNYCGTSHNYGGVAIFTPFLFPELSLNRTLFEHWAPPLHVIRDAVAKHANATHDVRLFIAGEIEAERAPIDRTNAVRLNHLEQKVGEYVMSLIVQHKRRLWSCFWHKDFKKGLTVSVADWADVCADVIGRHFPWRTLLAQLEVEGDDTVEGGRGSDDGVKYIQFLQRFRANVRPGVTVVDTWESAVVRGFFAEIFSNDISFQNDLLKLETVSAEQIKQLLQSHCTTLTHAHVQIFIQGLFEWWASSKSSAASITPADILASCSEYYRSYCDLISAAPEAEITTTEEIAGRIAEMFPKLRVAITGRAPGLSEGEALVEFFKSSMLYGQEMLALQTNVAKDRLEEALKTFGMTEYIPLAHEAIQFIAYQGGKVGNGYVSLLRFVAACYMDGSGVGGTVRARIAEHATAAVYFHRNALRCACAHLDTMRCGQLKRHSFKRAFHALNAAVESEWKLSPLQAQCVIEYMAWEFDDEAEMAASNEDEKGLYIEYDTFLDSFEISDYQKMSRTCSFGWHLLKDSTNHIVANTAGGVAAKNNLGIPSQRPVVKIADASMD